MSNFWSAGFWKQGFWATGFWGDKQEAAAGGGKLSASKRNRLTYVEQDGKIYLFEKPSHAADWIAQQNAISAAKQLPATQTAKKRKVKGPVEVIRIAEVRQLARRYDYPSVPRLIEEKDLSALVAIYHKLIELQDEEDVEMLLMAAAI